MHCIYTYQKIPHIHTCMHTNFIIIVSYSHITQRNQELLVEIIVLPLLRTHATHTRTWTCTRAHTHSNQVPLRLSVVELTGVTADVWVSKLMGYMTSEWWKNLGNPGNRPSNHHIQNGVSDLQVICGGHERSSNTDMEDITVGRSIWEKSRALRKRKEPWIP